MPRIGPSFKMSIILQYLRCRRSSLHIGGLLWLVSSWPCLVSLVMDRASSHLRVCIAQNAATLLQLLFPSCAVRFLYECDELLSHRM